LSSSVEPFLLIPLIGVMYLGYGIGIVELILWLVLLSLRLVAFFVWARRSRSTWQN